VKCIVVEWVVSVEGALVNPHPNKTDGIWRVEMITSNCSSESH